MQIMKVKKLYNVILFSNLITSIMIFYNLGIIINKCAWEIYEFDGNMNNGFFNE